MEYYHNNTSTLSLSSMQFLWIRKSSFHAWRIFLFHPDIPNFSLFLSVVYLIGVTIMKLDHVPVTHVFMTTIAIVWLSNLPIL